MALKMPPRPLHKTTPRAPKMPPRPLQERPSAPKAPILLSGRLPSGTIQTYAPPATLPTTKACGGTREASYNPPHTFWRARRVKSVVQTTHPGVQELRMLPPLPSSGHRLAPHSLLDDRVPCRFQARSKQVPSTFQARSIRTFANTKINYIKCSKLCDT